MLHLKKAELTERVVYMAAALRCRRHDQPHSAIMACLGIYCARTSVVETQQFRDINILSAFGKLNLALTVALSGWLN
jgi:hypothetical protein